MPVPFCHRLLGAILPAAAILSLACGPSPSAAYARAADQQARARSSKQTNNPAQPAKAVAEPSSKDGSAPSTGQAPPSTPAKPRKPLAGGAFVAPSSAKPSEGKVAELALALAAGNAPISGLECTQHSTSAHCPGRCRALHRAAYLALAPPLA